MNPSDTHPNTNPNANRGVSDGSGLEAIHRIFRPSFLRLVQKVTEEYGLGAALELANKNKTRLQILDIGCAEGLYLHDIAQFLEERQLLGAAEFIGVDINPDSIIIAEEYSKVSKPPRPYLKFFTCDATQPFETSLDFKALGQYQFDFIYSIYTVELLPNARQHIERFYNNLKPGGVIYLSSIVAKKGQNGWLSVHPALEIFDQWFFDNIASANPGVVVAHDTAEWLKELGAVQLSAHFKASPTGGPTEIGRLQLRNIISIIRNNTVPELINNGTITQAQVNELWATLSKELGPDRQGQIGIVQTLARKPFD